MSLETRRLRIAVAQRSLVVDLSLRFEAGQNWAVLGANGAGKTLLLHTLAGLRPASGEVLLAGASLNVLSARKRAQQISLLLQEQAETSAVTVLEFVLAARFAHLRPWEWETDTDVALARTALAAVDLMGYEMRLLETLSGGERRRCAIAAAITQDTPISLWDEPTNHLDLRHQFGALQLICARAQAGRSNIFVLHDVNLAARFCSHALLLFGDGRHQAGKIETVLTEDNLGALYGCAMRRLDLAGSTCYLPM